MLVLITGGASSGKSKFAEQYSAYLSNQGIYIATAQIYDEEMLSKVEKHKLQREQTGLVWQTIEEPYHLTELLLKKPLLDGIVLIDCLTLWLSNWILKFEVEEESTLKGDYVLVSNKINELIDELLLAIQSVQGTLLMVTNEVGDGIVPEYPLGRIYRDLAGKLNKEVANICDQVFLVTAGIPLELKKLGFQFDTTAG